MKKLPAPTAQNINEAHRLARSTAESAVQHAIQCGRLLAAKKDQLDRGEFDAWVAEHCEFGRATAYNYMKHAKSSNALDGSAIRHLFPSGQPGAKPKRVTVSSEKGGHAEADAPKPSPTAEAGVRASSAGPHAEPFADDACPWESGELGRSLEHAQVTDDEPERPDIDDAEEDAALERAEARARDDRDRRVDKILESDDQLAEALAQLKQQSALIATLETTRDGYMRGKDAVTQLLKVEQAKVSRLEKKLKAAEAEIEKLRERIAIMEAA